MSVNYGFFNSVNGDRLYNADDISNFFYKLISDGVLATPASNLQVVTGGGMRINVQPGWGMINAKYINLTAVRQITLDTADIALNRIDRIVMRLDRTNRQIVLAAKSGSPAASPAPPALTRTDSVWELSLAKIAVSAGATVIQQSDITDERSNTSVCGYITGMIDQIDTTELFAQFQSAFEQWFDGVKDEVLRNTLVRQYTNRVTSTEASQSAFAVGINDYNPSLDMLNVYVNGFRLGASEYTISEDANDGAVVTLTAPLDVIGTPVDFQVLKCIDGAQAESIVATVASLQQTLQDNYWTKLQSDQRYPFATRLGGLSFVALTQAEYDAITTPDENTVYIIKGAST